MSSGRIYYASNLKDKENMKNVHNFKWFIWFDATSVLIWVELCHLEVIVGRPDTAPVENHCEKYYRNWRLKRQYTVQDWNLMCSDHNFSQKSFSFSLIWTNAHSKCLVNLETLRGANGLIESFIYQSMIFQIWHYKYRITNISFP